MTLALARRGFDTVGVDHSEQMLAVARDKLEDDDLTATLETADVRELRFRDGEFDCVTCQGLLHHLEEVDSCLSELNRVLRPGGFFFLSEPSSDETPVKRLLRAVWTAIPRPSRRDLREGKPETVEEPIDPIGMRRSLDKLGLEYEIEFLTHLPPLRRHLPDRLYLLVSRALTLPWRRRCGDLLFVYGRKRQDAGR